MRRNTDHEKPSGRTYSRLALSLAVCLLCISTFLTGSTLAKFTSKASSAKEPVKVAVFAADAGTEADGNLVLDSTTDITSASYTFWVSNKENGAVSEVTNKYSIIVKLSNRLPDGLTLKLDGAEGNVSLNGRTYTFTNAAWRFPAGTESTRNHTLTYNADFDVLKDDFTATNIEVLVQVKQVD